MFTRITLYCIIAASPLASRGFAPRDIITSSITYPAEQMANFRTYPAGGFFLFFGGLGVSHPLRKKLKTTAGPIGIYPEE